MDEQQQEVRQALEAREVAVQVQGARWEAHTGSGRNRRQVSFTLEALGEALRDPQAPPRRAATAGFVSGVDLVLSETPGHKARSWGFVEAAGRLIPTVQPWTFGVGHQAACGLKPWSVPFEGWLRTYYLLELDFGFCALTQEQVQRWGVSQDRVTSAGRSLLFHKSWEAQPTPEQEWEVYTHHDGHNAARALVLADMDYPRARKGLYFAMPSPDRLMVMDQYQGPEALQRFTQAAQDALAQAKVPLSDTIYTWEDARHLRRVQP